MYWQPVGSLVSPEYKAKRMLIDKISMAAFSASSSVAAVLEVKETVYSDLFQDAPRMISVVRSHCTLAENTGLQ